MARPGDARHEAPEDPPQALGGQTEGPAGDGQGLAAAKPAELGPTETEACEGMMKPREQQIRRQLELANLSWAARLGLHDDRRWREALERIRAEQKAEREKGAEGP